MRPPDAPCVKSHAFALLFLSISCISLRLTCATLCQETLGELAEEVRQEEAQQSGGAVDFTQKRKPRRDYIPGWMLRPGAPKMQLRPGEEALLPLVRPAAKVGCAPHAPVHMPAFHVLPCSCRETTPDKCVALSATFSAQIIVDQHVPAQVSTKWYTTISTQPWYTGC